MFSEDMKTRLSKIFSLQAILATMLFVVLFATPIFGVLSVHAAASFNDDPQDFATLRSSNFTKFPNSTSNWAATTNADAGEVVSLTIYYHNTSSEDATNVRAAISVPTTAGTSIVAFGDVSADNASPVSGQTTINLSSSQTLTYIPGSTKWYPNQSLSPVAFPSGQTGDEFITSVGVNLGTIGPGTQANSFATQGSVVARFQVSNTGTGPTNPDPTVDIKANNSDGPITLAQNDSINLTWTSTNASSCTLGAPINSGVGTSGSTSFGVGHPFFSATSTVTYTITCDNGAGKTATDSVTVNPFVNPVSATLDITANGSQGPVTLAQGQPLTLDWTSTNVLPSSCMLSIQAVQSLGSVSANGQAGPILPGNSSYPPAGGSYTYVIACADAQGNAVTDTVVVLAPAAPQLPAAPTITATTGSQCGGQTALSWNSVPTATSYKVFRNGVLITTLPSTVFTDTNLTPGTTYSYTVVATNTAGDSAQSNTATAVASAVCQQGSATVDITVNGVQGPLTLTPNQPFTLNWVSTNASSCTLATLAGAQLGPVLSNGSAGPFDTTNPNYPAQGASQTFVITCQGSQGQVSDSVTVVRPFSGQTPVAPVITATTGTLCGGNITLSWNAVSGATSYTVLRAGVVIASVTSPTYTDTNLTPATSFSYTVRAVNSVGPSVDSNTATATSSSACIATPNAPLLTASTGAQCGGTIALSWTSVSNTSFYKIFRAGAQIATTTATTFTDTGLATSTSYLYTVKASNSFGDSFDSNAVSVVSSAACTNPAPVVTLTATPASIIQGQNSILTWTAVNATSCSALWTTATSTSGTQQVSPATTTPYSIDCTNGTQTVTATTTVTVTPNNGGGGPTAPTVTLVATPPSITQGQNSTLSWTSTNATSCSAPWTTATSTSGSLVVSPATTTAYSIGCTNGVASATSTATITVVASSTPTVTASLSANPTTVTAGQGSTLSWSSTNATSCSAVWTTATSTSGSVLVTPGSTTTYDINCTNGTQSATSTATVTVNVPTSGGGGGGSSGGGSGSSGQANPAGHGGSRGGSSLPALVLGTSTSCDYLKDYLKIDWVNDRVEVIKLQVFLRELEGFKNLQITGVFDQATFDAVGTFQERYIGDILTPWGHTSRTGFVYILTKKKVNEIVCQRAFPINAQQAAEIADFHAFLESLKNAGVPANQLPGATTANGDTATNILSENGKDFIATNDVDTNATGNTANETTNNTSARTRVRAAAAAIFAGPKGWDESVNAIVIFVTILLALYLIVRSIGDTMNKKLMLSPEGLRQRKLFFGVIGLVIAAILCAIFAYYVIVLPLLLLIIAISSYLLYTTFKGKENQTLLTIVEPQKESDVVILGAEPVSEVTTLEDSNK